MIQVVVPAPQPVTDVSSPPRQGASYYCRICGDVIGSSFEECRCGGSGAFRRPLRQRSFEGLCPNQAGCGCRKGVRGKKSEKGYNACGGGLRNFADRRKVRRCGDGPKTFRLREPDFVERKRRGYEQLLPPHAGLHGAASSPPRSEPDAPGCWVHSVMSYSLAVNAAFDGDAVQGARAMPRITPHGVGHVVLGTPCGRHVSLLRLPTLPHLRGWVRDSTLLINV